MLLNLALNFLFGQLSASLLVTTVLYGDCVLPVQCTT